MSNLAVARFAHCLGTLIISLDDLPEDGETISLFSFTSAQGSFENIIVDVDSECNQVSAEEQENNGVFEVILRYVIRPAARLSLLSAV